MIVLTTNSNDQQECEIDVDMGEGNTLCDVVGRNEADCVQVHNGKLSLNTRAMPKVYIIKNNTYQNSQLEMESQ